MTNRFKHIVVMGNDVDRLGGVGRFMNSIATGLSAAGYSVELLGVSPAPEGHHANYQRPASIGARTLMPEPPPADWQLRTPDDHRDRARVARNARRAELRAIAVSTLRELLGSWDADTVIICTQVYGMEHLLEAGYDPRDLSQPRVIGQYHGSHREAVHTHDLRRVLNAYAEVDRFICLSQTDAELFRDAGLNNVGWIPNPVPIPVSNEAPRRQVFVSLGRYDPIKSLEYFIQAWALIESKLPQWSIELFGEGEEREMLQGTIDGLGLKRASLMGMTNDVGTVLKSASVHVMSSQNEGLPLAIVEAGYMGTPTATFDSAPGISFLVEDGTDGFVVPLNHVAALADRMLELAQDADLRERMGGAAQQAAQRFLPEVVVGHWEAELEEMSR